MKKERILKISVLLLVFILSLAGFNYYYAEKKNEAASEMLRATLPVLGVRVGDQEINRMHGYVDSIDESLLRDSIIPVDAAESFYVDIQDYDYDITAIYYQIYGDSEEEVLEEGVLNKLKEKKEIKSQKLTIRTALEPDREYMIRFTIRLDSSRKVNYYSRLKYGTSLHFREALEYTEKLSDMMLDKNENLKAYLEPDAEMISNNLAEVNIHSSYEAVTYAQTRPEKKGNTVVLIKEINEDYTAVERRFLLAMKNGKGQEQYCNIIENYKVRYSPGRMYLLDYERTQEAFYNPEYLDQANNRISLGTGLNRNVPHMISEDNEKACFVRERQLWYYNYQSASVTKVFSFLGEDLTDERAGYDQHGIHILDMDEKGNISFLVYGYMNRGRHEGMNGIALFRFDSESSTNEELAFIPTNTPYQNIQEDIEKFSYLNVDHNFYFLLNGTLYKVQTEDGKWEILRENMVENSLTASSDNSIIAIQHNADSTKNQKITIMDLNTGKEDEIVCADGERIQSVGFILSDFVYGTADARKVKVTSKGTVEFPMYKTDIINSAGETVKTYQRSTEYVIHTEIDGNVIRLTYGVPSSDGYRETDTEYVRFKAEEEGYEVSVVYGYDTVCYNQIYLQFPPYIYVQTVPALKVTKEIISDESKVVNVEETGTDTSRYMVYVNGTLKNTYSTVYDAIREAEEKRGLVVNSRSQTVWESNIPGYNQVLGLNMQKAGTRTDTYAACIAMMASLHGDYMSQDVLKGKTPDPVRDLGTYAGTPVNLNGCTLEQVLYYIGKEIPVLAKTAEDHYVLLVSYNSTKVRYMDPLKGEDVVEDRDVFVKRMKKMNNEFYSYLK